jgi:hypothetical protein
MSTTPDRPAIWTREKIVWWVTFGVLVLSAIAMLGAWD